MQIGRGPVNGVEATLNGCSLTNLNGEESICIGAYRMCLAVEGCASHRILHNAGLNADRLVGDQHIEPISDHTLVIEGAGHLRMGDAAQKKGSEKEKK